MLQDPNVERLIENAIKPLRKEIERLNSEINELKIQLSIVHKDRHDPRKGSLYDSSHK